MTYFPPLPPADNQDDLARWLSGRTIPVEQISGQWKTWTPTYTNLTVGDGTVVARYIEQVSLVVAEFEITFGGTSAMGASPTVSLPVTAALNFTASRDSIGTCHMFDTAPGNNYHGEVQLASTSAMRPRALLISATYLRGVTLTSAIPMTWATGDILYMRAAFEAA